MPTTQLIINPIPGTSHGGVQPELTPTAHAGVFRMLTVASDKATVAMAKENITKAQQP